VKPWLSKLIDYALYAALAVILFKFVSRKLSGPKEGAVAAPFEMAVVGKPGAPFRLAEHRGKPVLIEVFASWCPSCQRSAPALRESWQHHQHAVDFVGVSVDPSLDDAARARADWNIPYDVGVDDGHIARAYGIEVLPTFVLVDSAGRVRRVSTGSVSTSELDRWLTEL
jgi:peroxiredoxin